ncbi:translation elongation factor ts [Candidatus Omnitrophus magneticus]|uniref:Elongation factor Ts n=1 Tax=Candidatus Omnitrophus magneticus TaxID=1609969 RepID=A0A0F0CMS5_9BACT|nr:translation elongation factor ts [Candidatus Omnitrophus magneticus]
MARELWQFCLKSFRGDKMVKIEDVKKLREKTGSGMVECKEALEEAAGNIDKAIEILRKKGMAKAAKKSTRTASQGIVDSYIHMGNRIGVLLEVNCETDFVARNDDFKALVKDIAMQIAACNPKYVSREEVPQDVLNKEKEICASQIQGKPANVVDKIVVGKIEKYYAEVCLLEQPFIKDPNVSIKSLVTQLIAKIGENILVRRFVRYELGEEE